MPLARWVPGLDSLLHYRRAWFRPDVQAGLSVAAILLFTGMMVLVAVLYRMQSEDGEAVL